MRRWILAAVVIAALAACGKKDEAATTAVAPTAASATAPAAASAPEEKKGGLFDFMGKDEPAPSGPDLGQFQVLSVTLGSAVDGDHDVREGKTVFAPKDAIHAAVLSTGPHAGLTLVAHWTAADGTVVAHSEQPIVPTGPQVTTFSLKNSAPWPPGMYQVAILVGGQTLQSRAFEVKEAQ